jgi:lysophospholipase L1-like esterase
MTMLTKTSLSFSASTEAQKGLGYLSSEGKGTINDGAHLVGLARLIRTLWRAAFFSFLIFCVGWFIKNVFTGSYISDLSYYIPVTVSLVASLSLAYVFAFRLQEARLVNLNMSLVVLGASLLASEIVVRLWDRYDPIFRPSYLEDNFVYKITDQSFINYRPGSIGMTHGHTVRINAWGFRGPEWPATKPPGGFRIIVMGDSFTFGQGIGEEERYTTLLEKQLRAKFSGKTLEVLNLGVAGYSAVDEAILLEKIGPLLHPDLVLVQFTGNDVREQVPERERYRWALPIPEGVKTLILHNSKFMSWLAVNYDQLLMNLGFRPNTVASLEAAYDSHSGEWKVFVGSYRRMLEWTQAQRIPPPLVGLFLAPQYSDAQLNDFIDMTPAIRMQDRFVKQVGATLSEIGIPTVDYLLLFRRYNKQNMIVSKWEGHPNALANRLYAEGFLDAITSRNLIP